MREQRGRAMTPIEHEVLQRFRTLLVERVSLRSLVLFGSRARGDADPDSDVDVLVVVDRLDEDTQKHVSYSAWEAGFPHGLVLVPVTVSRDEWENGPERHSLLAQAVAREGIPV